MAIFDFFTLVYKNSSNKSQNVSLLRYSAIACQNAVLSTIFPTQGAAVSTKNLLFPTQGPGGTILSKNVLFTTQEAEFLSNMSYLQLRGHNFNQKCHITSISRPGTFPPAHWRLILFIHDFSLVIGGKLHSEYLGFSLLVANYSRNIPVFSTLAARLQTHTICLLNIPNNSLYNASYYMCRKITSHWQPLFSLRKWRRRPHFPTKLATVASFSIKIGGGGLFFLQNYRRRQGFGNITAGCSDMVWIAIGYQV